MEPAHNLGIDGMIGDVIGGGQQDIAAAHPGRVNESFDLNTKVKQVPEEFIENGVRNPVYFLKMGEEIFGPSYTYKVSRFSIQKLEKENFRAFPLFEQKVTV